MGTLPGRFRGLGGWPKHRSPLIQVNFIKHFLGLWDGWHGNRVLTGREKSSPASRCSWPQLMALPWKLSRRKLPWSWGLNGAFFWIFQKLPPAGEEACLCVHGCDCSEDLGKPEGVCSGQNTPMWLIITLRVHFICKSNNTELRGYEGIN